MALGDGIRRNIATVSVQERERLRDAILALHQRYFPGSRSDTPTGHVSYWFKQDEIHAHTHVHGVPAFIPWHRELVNRFEALIRGIDPQLSLHYWDWTQDPTQAPDGSGGFVNLFTADFMGSGAGEAGEPWLSGGFYDPDANPFRSASEFDPNNNPDDPPQSMLRMVQPGAPVTGMEDTTCVGQLDFPSFDNAIRSLHDASHGFIGGVIGDAHTSFRDPFVFLLHSNVDRLFALWQLQSGHPERLDPSQVYGAWSATTGSGDVALGNPNWGILSPLEPWAGPAAQNSSTGVVANVSATRPWAAPENEQNLAENQKDSRHPSVVQPPCYDTNPTVITVVNPGNLINFNDVPTAETTVRAAHFRVITCIPLTFRVTAAPAAPYSVFTPPGNQVPVAPGPDLWTDVRLWMSFTGGAADTAAPAGNVTIHCDETHQDFAFTISGNSIARPTVASMLVLDQSGSMDDPAGTTGVTRISALREAAALFVDVIQPGNAVGVVRFDTVAYPVSDPTYPGLAPTTIGIGGIFDPGRAAARAAVNAHATNPNGATSIGAGVALGRSTLNPVTGFRDKALIVFTDGLENTSPFIADVLGNIDQRTFAIGLGNPQQVSTAALTALSNGTGGHLLLTGLLSASTEDFFLLSKYFLQILAGVTNTDVVLDPAGFLPAGVTVQIPFTVTEADIESTVLLITDIPAARFALQTPGGDLITPATAAGAGSTFNDAGRRSYYRHTLPLALPSAGAGTWQAVLELDDKLFDRYCGQHDFTHGPVPTCPRAGIRYSLSAMAWSNLRLRTQLSQSRLTPGATLNLSATLDEYGQPLDHRAAVVAHITASDGSTTTLPLTERSAGHFAGSFHTTAEGVYPVRVVAAGVTLRGAPFTREQALTGAVFHGGDQPPSTTPPKQGDLCCLLDHLTREDTIRRYLQERGIDADAVRKAIAHCCAG
jgi:Common central domain of tyrosinase/von Willebrand factor type A domain